MEEQSLKKQYGFLQGAIYVFVILDVALFIFYRKGILSGTIWDKVAGLGMYQNALYSKLLLAGGFLIIAIGSNGKKKIDLDALRHIYFPLVIACILISIGMYSFVESVKMGGAHINYYDYIYIATIFLGFIFFHVGLNNISKIVRDKLLSDRFNVEGETFQQNKKLVTNDYSINYPINFYYKKKQSGWMNITNPFRGTVVIGTPGSGKSFSIIIPYIKQIIKKGFTGVIYDFKYPDLGEICYYHYLLKRQSDPNYNYDFHVVNLDDVERSRRVNPLRADYIDTLGKSMETAEALIEALKKGVKSSGDSQFFDVSARNFLAAVFYFFAKYKDGKHSNLPFILHFLDLEYESLFDVLFKNPEINSLLTPFKSAYYNKTFKQLEGQLGTLRINLSALNTKEANWVFGGDDIDLKISNPDKPSILILANSTENQSSNSATQSILINRIIKLVNTKHNLPTALVVDEVPTIYLHKIENLIATARSNKVAVMLGLQEITQFRQQYGKEISDTILSVIANTVSGQVHSKETTEYLQNMFGKTKLLRKGMSLDYHKTNVNLNEHSDYLIPASKFASLKTGQMAAKIAGDDREDKYENSFFNCTINIDIEKIKAEEKEYSKFKLPKYYKFEDKEKQLFNNYIKNQETVKKVVEDILKNEY